MAKTSSIHVRVEPQTKKKVEKILSKLGMTSAEAITIYLNQIILNSGIPFDIKIPEYTDDMKEAIKEADDIIKNPKKHKKYKNIDSLMEDLHNGV